VGGMLESGSVVARRVRQAEQWTRNMGSERDRGFAAVTDTRVGDRCAAVLLHQPPVRATQHHT